MSSWPFLSSSAKMFNYRGEGSVLFLDSDHLEFLSKHKSRVFIKITRNNFFQKPFSPRPVAVCIPIVV